VLFDLLVEEAAKTSEAAERERLYYEAQRTFKENAPWATIAHANQFMLVRPEVDGPPFRPMGNHSFVDIGLTE